MAKIKILTNQYVEIKFENFALDCEGLYYRSYGSKVVGFVLSENTLKYASYYRSDIKEFITLLSNSSNIEDFFDALDTWYENNLSDDSDLDEIHAIFSECFLYNSKINEIIFKGLECNSKENGYLVCSNNVPLIELFKKKRSKIFSGPIDTIIVPTPTPKNTKVLIATILAIILLVFGYNNREKVKSFIVQTIPTDTLIDPPVDQPIDQPIGLNINTHHQGNGYISVNDTTFENYKVYFSTSNKKINEIHWDKIQDSIKNNQKVYIKETGTIYFRGQEGTKTGMASIQLDYTEIVANLIITHSPELENLFDISDEPLQGTKVYVNGERLQSKSLLGDQIIDECLSNGGRITKIETEQEHKSILDPEYPTITRIEFSTK